MFSCYLQRRVNLVPYLLSRLLGTTCSHESAFLPICAQTLHQIWKMVITMATGWQNSDGVQPHIAMGANVCEDWDWMALLTIHLHGISANLGFIWFGWGLCIIQFSGAEYSLNFKCLFWWFSSAIYECVDMFNWWRMLVMMCVAEW